MPIVDFYSSRAQGAPDVWVYDRIPKVLRVQVSNLVVGALGTTDEYHRPNSRELYESIRNETMHEHGRHWLASKHAPAQDDMIQCIENELSLPVWLDLVELSFRCIEKICGNYDRYKRRELEITMPADEAITEVNERFRRAGFGYRYDNQKMIRLDSEFLHQEATRPALRAICASPELTMNFVRPTITLRPARTRPAPSPH